MNYAIIIASYKEASKLEKPICVYPLLKKPIIEYVVDQLEKLKIDQIFCYVDSKNQEIEEILKDRVTYITKENHKDLDIQKGGYTLVLPGNVLLINTNILKQIIDQHVTSQNDVTILAGKEDCIEDVQEYKSQILCLKNHWLNESSSLEGCPFSYNLKEGFKKGKIGKFFIQEDNKLNWIENLYTLSLIEDELRKEINKTHMLNGVCIMNPNSTTISLETVIESGTVIYPGCNIFGKTTIGHNCIVGPNTELNNSVLEDNTKCIHSMVSDSKICKGATVGPFTQLRMHSVVGENDRVGNFVEMKNSVLGKNTNVAHLTYIGDTTCGDHVNWGCGTVTVNYDGKNKFKTTIGNDVFIGCNTNLIAPINIASNSFIAAGSTITEDLVEGDFAIARNKQVVKHNRAQNYGFKK